MKHLLLFFFLILAIAIYSSGQTCGVKCGAERWPVKTLSDSTVSHVNFKPKRKTVHWLVNSIPPDSRPDTTRINGLEWMNFRVKAVLVGYKKEAADHDFHVVIRDLKTSETMIVEFPDSSCSGVCSSKFISDMENARSDFLNSSAVQERGSPTARFKPLNKRVIVEVIGIGFWDFKHGQTGLAKNAIELHPVIGFKVVK